METRENPSWANASEDWARLDSANRRATKDWLRSLAREESIRLFEELSEGIPEAEWAGAPDEPPVVLFRIWKM
ncbi:MAG: hypothetical protein HUU15_08285 [Candidatus Brocadiae bacterium]|nr:hypothetical protein [Candidatus Brocadiia bacterium]